MIDSTLIKKEIHTAINRHLVLHVPVPGDTRCRLQILAEEAANNILKEKEMELWEILVPTVSNEGKPYRLRYHRVWDKKVYEITGGLTILSPAKGRWISPTGTLFAERMIPVRIACDREKITEILKVTMKHYDQEAVMAYKVSEEVIIMNRET